MKRLIIYVTDNGTLTLTDPATGNSQCFQTAYRQPYYIRFADGALLRVTGRDGKWIFNYNTPDGWSKMALGSVDADFAEVVAHGFEIPPIATPATAAAKQIVDQIKASHLGMYWNEMPDKVTSDLEAEIAAIVRDAGGVK